MKIGILGTRGIPNAYGGFEQFAQFLAAALVARGHQVLVYCSSLHPYQEREWQGVQLIHCRDPEDQLGTAGQFLYDRNCLLDAGTRNFDILLQLGYTSNSVWHSLWPETVNIVNMDGLEWKRSKYNYLTKRFLKWAEQLAVRHAQHLIADSKGIQDYLGETYGKTSTYIPYGADIPAGFDEKVLMDFGLEKNKYYLVIARMEPENHIREILEGYEAAERQEPLLVIGATTNKYGGDLRKKYENGRIRFSGPLYHMTTLNALRHYALLYLHGHSVGGTNPSLLEAMACGCGILAHDNPFNRSVLGEDAAYFSSANDMSRLLNHPADPESWQNRKQANLQKIRDSYSWPSVVDAYENLFLQCINAKPPIDRKQPAINH